MLWLISLQAPQIVAHNISEALEPFTESVSLFEDKTDSTLWQIQALTSVMPPYDDLQQMIKTICNLHKISLPLIHLEEIPDKNWLTENEMSFSPLAIGSFYIHGAQYGAKGLPPDKICLQIDASTAFGTGRHGTTQGCLEALEILHEEGLKLQSILDIGTGTGILAIACAKIFKRPVIATDIDPEAIHKANENTHLNGCASLVSLIKAEGLNHPDLESHQPFDLIIANIFANTLIELSSFITKVTQPRSILILSGILQDQAPHVEKAFQHHDFLVRNRIIHEEWTTLVLMSNYNASALTFA